MIYLFYLHLIRTVNENHELILLDQERYSHRILKNKQHLKKYGHENSN